MRTTAARISTYRMKKARLSAAGFFRRTAVKQRLRAARFLSLSRNRTAASGLAAGFGRCIAALIAVCRALAVPAGRACTRIGARLGGLYSSAEDAVREAEQRLYLRCESVRLRAHRRKKRESSRAVPVIMLATATVMIVSAVFFGVGLEVSVDGQPIGFVHSKNEMREIVSQVERRASEYLGVPYNLDMKISYSLKYMEKDNMINGDAVREMLFSSVSEQGSSYVLVVDGKAIGSGSSRAVLEMMLRRLKASRVENHDVKTDFVQEVGVVERAGTADIVSLRDMVGAISGNHEETMIYTVTAGDTVSAIAKAYGVSVKELEELNPSLDADKINIGDELKVSAAVPVLSVKQTIHECYNEEIAFETVTEYDSGMYTNESRVRVKGVKGEAYVEADVEYVDGRETRRTVDVYEVLREPVSQVRVVGTKQLPKKAATGKFIKPSKGVYSSGYGYRRSMGDFHTGVDFAGSKGTAIWASDGGTVSFAGTKGNYGKLVIIDHGNGYTTYYAHCSSLLVKKGQKVAKGETIAKVGSTGRSTGPHCHFEIRYNGKTVNPLNYISK